MKSATKMKAKPGTHVGWLEVRPIDEHRIDLHITGDVCGLVQFNNPKLFGEEFALLKSGSNIFTYTTGKVEETDCYVITESDLSKMLRGSSAMTGPIVIPPKPGPNPPRYELGERGKEMYIVSKA